MKKPLLPNSVIIEVLVFVWTIISLFVAFATGTSSWWNGFVVTTDISAKIIIAYSYLHQSRPLTFSSLIAIGALMLRDLIMIFLALPYVIPDPNGYYAGAELSGWYMFLLLLVLIEMLVAVIVAVERFRALNRIKR